MRPTTRSRWGGGGARRGWTSPTRPVRSAPPGTDPGARCTPARRPSAPAEQQERVGGDARGVADQALGDHLLEVRAAHPALAHVLLLGLAPHRPRGQAGGEEDVHPLAAVARSLVEVAEVLEALGAQPGLLGELDPGELGRVPVLAVRQRPLGELPRPRLDRVAVLLDEVEAAALGGDDQREVRLVDDPVGADRAVGALDLVLADAHPAVLVDGPRREAADGMHAPSVISRRGPRRGARAAAPEAGR